MTRTSAGPSCGNLQIVSQHCTAVHCTALYCTVLHGTALHCVISADSALHYTLHPRLAIGPSIILDWDSQDSASKVQFLSTGALVELNVPYSLCNQWQSVHLICKYFIYSSLQEGE